MYVVCEQCFVWNVVSVNGIGLFLIGIELELSWVIENKMELKRDWN